VRGSVEGDARRPTGQDGRRHGKETTQDDGTGLKFCWDEEPPSDAPSFLHSEFLMRKFLRK